MSPPLHLSFFLPSLEGGGAERVVSVLANALVDASHPVDVYLTAQHGPYVSSLHEDVSLFDFSSAHTSHTVPSLIRLLRRRRPDVLVSALPSATVAAYGAVSWLRVWDGCAPAFCATVHSLPTRQRERADTLRARLLFLAFRWVLQRTETVVGVSDAVARDLASFTGRPAHAFSVIPNPLAPEFRRDVPSSAPAHPWLGQDTPVVVAVGRLSPDKDYPLLLRALARLPAALNVHTLILGDGPQRPSLQTQCRALGLADTTDLLGFVNNPRPFMAQADVLVLPSPSEAFGNVIIEALASGTPAIAMEDSGGPEDLLGTMSAGYPALSPRTPGHLAKAIAETLQTPPPPSSLKARAHHFRASAIADRYLALFNTISVS